MAKQILGHLLLLPSYEWAAVMLGFAYFAFIIVRLVQWLRYTHYLLVINQQDLQLGAYNDCVRNLAEMERCLRRLLTNLQEVDQRIGSNLTVEQLSAEIGFEELGRQFNAASKVVDRDLMLATGLRVPRYVLDRLRHRQQYLVGYLPLYIKSNRTRRRMLAGRLK